MVVEGFCGWVETSVGGCRWMWGLCEEERERDEPLGLSEREGGKDLLSFSLYKLRA